MEIAALLGDRQAAPEYLDWLRWVARFADVHQNRELFDLVLDAVRKAPTTRRRHELWLTAHDLAKHEPLWAIELLRRGSLITLTHSRSMTVAR